MRLGAWVPWLRFGICYIAMLLATLCAKHLCLLHWLPSRRGLAVTAARITFNFTAVLNIGFTSAAGVLVAAFLRSGGPAMMPHDEEQRAWRT